MDAWNFVAGGAAIGVIAGFWDKIKAVIWRVLNLFIQQVEIPAEPAHNALVAYLVGNYKRSRFYERMYGAWYEHSRDGKYGLVAYEQFGNRSVVFWDGWRPFIFSNAQEKKPKSTANNRTEGGESSATKVYSTLTFLRGTIDMEQILRDACDRSNKLSWAVSSAEEEAKNRFVIHHVPRRGEEEREHGYGSNGLAWYQQSSYRLLTHTPDQLGKPRAHNGKALENLIFPRRVKNLIQEIELWRKNRQWYVDRGIPWKRGWMLYGPPGTGKTALARAFAEDLNMPIYVYNLAELGNHELMKVWSEMQVNVPCIALIEDIDNVFHGRKNVSRNAAMMPMLMPPTPNGDTGGNDNKKNDLFA